MKKILIVLLLVLAGCGNQPAPVPVPEPTPPVPVPVPPPPPPPVVTFDVKGIKILIHAEMKKGATVTLSEMKLAIRSTVANLEDATPQVFNRLEE